MSPRLDLPEAAERVLSTWLAVEGFGGPVAESVTRVRYTRADTVALEFSYWVEDPLPRSLMVGVGFLEPDGLRAMGAWEFIPDESEAGRYWRWRFDSQEGLETVLLRVRDEVLLPFLRPQWEDVDALRRRVADWEGRMHKAWQEGEDHRTLEQARRSFSDGRYHDAVIRYALVRSRLTPADQQRLKLARQRIDQPEEGPS